MKIITEAHQDGRISVAVSGEEVQRQDQCPNCHEPMLYRCHTNGEPHEMFCASAECAMFLIEVGL